MTDSRSSPPIRLQRPTFPSSDAIERYFSLARERHWYSNDGPCLELLRDRLRERTGCWALPVANGTLGLVVAVAALSRRHPGRDVIVPSFTFAATAQAVAWNGLRPVFVDVDAGSWHLCPEALGQVLAERGGDVSIVLACSSFGTPPPVAVRTAWEEACRDAGVPLLVDSAAGFGAEAEDGVPIGAQGDAEVVSFHATKPLAIGEGGAVLSRDQGLVAEMARLANFAFDGGHVPQDPRGINAKLDELHAATALAALDDLDLALKLRRARALELLGRVAPGLRPGDGHELGTFQLVPVVASSADARKEVLRRAEGRVELRTYHQPLHRSPAFAAMPTMGDLPVTLDLAARILSLPMYQDMTDDELDGIVAAVSLGEGEGGAGLAPAGATGREPRAER